MSSNTEFMSNLADEALRIITSVVKCPIDRIEYIPIGVMTHKFMAVDEDGIQYIIRIYPETRSDVVCFEPDVLRRCSQAGVLVPEVIADSRNSPRATHSYMVYRKLSGDRLTNCIATLSPSSRSRLGREIIDQLELLASVDFTGYGDLTSGDSAVCPSWAVFLNMAFIRGVKALEQYELLSGDLIKTLGLLHERVVARVPEPAPRLVWADISSDNIIVSKRGKLSGFIDFESALSGDCLLALGYCVAFDGSHSLIEMLVDSWPRNLTAEETFLIDLYAVIRVLRIAPYRKLLLPGGDVPAPLLTTFPGFEPALQRLTTFMKY